MTLNYNYPVYLQKHSRKDIKETNIIFFYVNFYKTKQKRS